MTRWILSLCLMLHALPAEAGERVDIELVLAVDTSISISRQEYEFQMLGIANALRSDEVIGIIEELGNGAVVTVVHWNLGAFNKQASPWHHLTDAQSVREFASIVATLPRQGAGRGTSIGQAIDFSARLLDENRFDGRFRRIDISGDSRSNSGPHPSFARDRAVKAEITINGLILGNKDRQLDLYFEKYVAGGVGSFVLRAQDFASFEEAMQRKLAREMSLNISMLSD